ncbi:MAG TPA: response regulator [Chloroflexi bacterium]|nr:response regulator [Chloroflexota bacterium]
MHRDTFDLLIRDVLQNSHSPTHLQLQRLVSAWPWHDQPADTRAQALRELVVDALEALQPGDSAPGGRTGRLGYDVLRLRYIECLTPEEVEATLGISHTSYYRWHREALDALVSLLWERYRREVATAQSESAEAATVSSSSLARQEALRVARESGGQVTPLREVVEDVLATIDPLLRQRGLALSCDLPADLPTVHIDPVVLRQSIVSALVDAVNLAESGSLRLSAVVSGEWVTLAIVGLDAGKARALGLDRLTGFTASQGLLTAYGGQITLGRDVAGTPSFCLAIPRTKAKMILIIDDDADTVGLYRRYLQAAAYTVRSTDSAHTWALLEEFTPDLVLLDILMPREDGWNILQGLRDNPRTANVPVVICSVLDQADLARALGAAEVLQKPIGQSELLRTVTRLLGETARQGKRLSPARA